MIQTQQDKDLLHDCIIVALEKNYQIALAAAQQAYETATNDETKSENKYDTFSLEASYLAHGQSKRVEECLNHIKIFKELNVCHEHDTIKIGSLVLVENPQSQQNYYFISPVSGGLKVTFKEQDIILITPNAPLGKKLMNGINDDTIELDVTNKQYLHIQTID